MPGEHFTAIRDPPPPTVYFTGDTSYRPMPFSTDDGPEILPVCPAFKDFALHDALQRPKISLEPPVLLAKECAMAGINEGVRGVYFRGDG
ncbi:hypothetical protein FB451DRAFT_1412217 [Mycena latifolia]|nr:hypothetical protein FB451DRAFT_1412217 [Mycena latifolia]